MKKYPKFMNMSRLIKRNLINNDGFATRNLYPVKFAIATGQRI